MAKVVAARVYLDKSIEYLPPSDSIHPPAAPGELRFILEDDQIHHLEAFNGREWVDLGEVTGELLKKHDLCRFKF